MRRRALSDGAPAASGVASEALDRAAAQVRLAVEAGLLPGCVLLVARRGMVVYRRAFGRTEPEPRGRPLREDDIFLVASLTKPIICLPVLQLVEAGEIGLDDPVGRFLPEFAGGPRDRVLVRHLLCHTSGLPDQLPRNLELRAARAPLEAFVEGACHSELAFEPGCGWQYQSMGILLAATIVERLCGRPTAAVLQDLVLGPLAIRTSFLGWRDGFESRLVPVDLAPADDADWNHNSRYWRRLGAPWGGLHATAADLAVILQMVLNGGSYGDVTLLGPAAAREMTLNQTALLPSLPREVAARCPWAFGWRLGSGLGDPDWPDLLSPRAFGHAGATGCLFFADPDSELLAVILTNAPTSRSGRLLARVGTILAGAWR